MTDEHDAARAKPVADPFVTQVNWLIAAAGGKDRLVTRTGNLVSARTLDNWVAGIYPRNKVTGAVRSLDAWAAEHMPGYPEAAGVPRLVDSCGPYRAPVSSVAPSPTSDGGPTSAPLPWWRRRPARWGLCAAVLVLVSAASVITTVVVDDDDRATATAATPASGTPADVSLARLRLPSTGDGKEYTEQAGSIGANSYQDPRTLAGRGQKIPPHTTLQVRCRYYAPSVPSVSPDGFWYLIDSDPWNGTWTPANSYMNGDVPGGPTLHNTDLAVPVCR